MPLTFLIGTAVQLRSIIVYLFFRKSKCVYQLTKRLQLRPATGASPLDPTGDPQQIRTYVASGLNNP